MTNYRFYKYRSINDHLFDSLKDGTIYFSRQKELNDPFDCELDIKKAIYNAANASSGEEAEKLNNLINISDLFDKFQENVNALGICSFSGEMNEFQTLLWSHYADNHKGVCILYEMPMSFVDNEDNILGTSKVTYEPNSLTEWFKSIAKRLPISEKKLITDLLKRILTAKSPPWNYESEVRIIRPDSGTFEIKKSFIKQICFGLQSTDEDIDKVKSVIKNYVSQVSLYKAVRGASDFGIEYKEL